MHGDGAAGVEMARHGGGGVVVEVADRVAIGRVGRRDFGRHRIEQRQFLDAGAQVALARCARALLALPALAKCATTSASASARAAFKRQQLRIARPDANADQTPAHRSCPRQRVDGGRGHGAAADAAAHDQDTARRTDRRRARPWIRRRRRSRPECRESPPASARRSPASRADETARSARCRWRPRRRRAGRSKARARRRSAWCRARPPAPARADRAACRRTSLPAAAGRA